MPDQKVICLLKKRLDLTDMILLKIFIKLVVISFYTYRRGVGSQSLIIVKVQCLLFVNVKVSAIHLE